MKTQLIITHPGSAHFDEVTIFDSTGLAIQDIVCTKIIYDKAVKSKTCSLTFFDWN